MNELSSFLFICEDCMHVTSEEGDFVFRKAPRFLGRVMGDRRHLIEAETEETPVCGAYFVTDPDKVVEVTVKYLDIDCEMGALVGVSNMKVI